MHYKNYIFVAIQIVLFIAFIFEIDSLKFNQLEFFQPVFLVLSGIGFLIILSAILELNTSLSPFPKPKNKASLVTTGVYRYIRHPIYTGILLGLFLSVYILVRSIKLESYFCWVSCFGISPGMKKNNCV